MPFIHVYAYSGRDAETKKKAAAAMVKAASETMGAPEAAFTVIYEDIEKEKWDADVVQTIIKPRRDKLLIEGGKLV